MPSVDPELASLLPPLSTGEFEALRASIERDGGVRDKIIVDENDVILDGHHRFKICPDAPTRIKPGLTAAEKMAFTIAANFQRRDLSPDQKVELRSAQIRVAAALKAEGATQEAIAGKLGVDQASVSRWLATNMQPHKGCSDSRVKVPRQERPTILMRTEAGEPHAQVAADFGISRQNVAKICAAERKRIERAKEIEQQKEDIAAGRVTAATGPFDVIVIDPPRPYGTQYDATGRRAANPYPEMLLKEIAALNVAEVAAPDCVLWLWTTHKFLWECRALFSAWGFEPKDTVTWDKMKMGLGSWLRSQSEFVVMAVRGKPEITLTNQTTIIRERAREHSRKPEKFYQLVESLCTGPRRYDWFAREPRAGWLVGGNDTERFAGGSMPSAAANNDNQISAIREAA